jgi:hypothetical protein
MSELVFPALVIDRFLNGKGRIERPFPIITAAVSHNGMLAPSTRLEN